MIDGDGDDVEVVIELAKAFGIEIADAEAQEWRTVGDIYAALQQKLNSTEPAKHCITARAYYKLREVLKTANPDSDIRPSIRIADLPHASWRELADSIVSATSYRVPRKIMTWVGMAGVILCFVSLYAFFFVGLFYTLWLPMLGLALGVFLVKYDSGVFAEGETVRSLSKKIAALNFARLRDVTTQPHSRQIWDALTIILAEYSPVDPQDIREDHLLIAP